MSQSPSNPPDPSRVNLDAKLEDEIQAALGDMSVADLIDTPKPKPRRSGGGRRGPDREERVLMRSGTVVGVRGDDVMVEFDPKTQGVCPTTQFTDTPPEVGTAYEFMMQRYKQDEGLWVLNRQGVIQRAEWDSLEIGQVVEARCTGMVRGGLECELAHQKAFLPASQVDVDFVKDISVFLNEKLTVEVIELDKRRKRIVVSRKKPLAIERAKMREEMMSSLTVGKTLKAKIRSIQPFGAFADIGGMDGLIHISDLSHDRVKHPSDVVKEGDEVEVQIMKIEDGKKRGETRISLSMKALLEDPFQARLAEITPGEQVSGKVTKIMDFGAFIEVAPGVEGLVHISELSHERVKSVAHVLKPDEVVTVQVLSVDPQSKRISLSIKALTSAPEDQAQDRGEDPEIRKMRAMLSDKFGADLKGGIGRNDGSHFSSY